MSEAIKVMTREELISECAELERERLAFADKCNMQERQLKEMQSHIDCLKAELAEIQMNKPELPTEPIKVVNMLIDEHIEHIKEFEECFTTENAGKTVVGRPIEEFRRMQIGKLRQIAEHLLVYCNHAEVE